MPPNIKENPVDTVSASVKKGTVKQDLAQLTRVTLHAFNCSLIVCLRVNLYLFKGKFILFFLILKLSYVPSYSVSQL